MNEARALTDLEDFEREGAILDEVEVFERFGRYALVRRVGSGDEELWSMRAGIPWCSVAQRLPMDDINSYSPRHAQMERRLWSTLLEAAHALADASDALDTAAAGGGQSAVLASLRNQQSSARWAASRAHKAYQRAATPPRVALPHAVRNSVVAMWERTGRRCGICGLEMAAGVAMAIDHALPVSRGGDDSVANLRVAHAACNTRRSAWVWDGGAAVDRIRSGVEPHHPSPAATFGCWFCGVPTLRYVDAPGLPLFRFCAEHADPTTVRGLLAGYGVPIASAGSRAPGG